MLRSLRVVKLTNRRRISSRCEKGVAQRQEQGRESDLAGLWVGAVVVDGAVFQVESEYEQETMFGQITLVHLFNRGGVWDMQSSCEVGVEDDVVARHLAESSWQLPSSSSLIGQYCSINCIRSHTYQHGRHKDSAWYEEETCRRSNLSNVEEGAAGDHVYKAKLTVYISITQRPPSVSHPHHLLQTQMRTLLRPLPPHVLSPTCPSSRWGRSDGPVHQALLKVK